MTALRNPVFGFGSQSGNQAQVTLFDGTQSVVIGLLDSTAHSFMPAGLQGLLSRAPIDFVADAGADPTGATPNDAAWLRFQALMKATSRNGNVSAGNFIFANAPQLDTYGWRPWIDGAGVYNTIFHVENVATSPQMQILAAGGTTAAPRVAFFLHLKGISIHGNTAGVVLGIGQHDFSDELNEFDIDIEVANANKTSATAATIEVNGSFNSRFFMIGNGGGSRTNGNALRVRQAQFCRFEGSYANAATSLYLTGGYVFGNTFLNLDMEEVQYDIVIDAATVSRNTWVGGQASYSVAAINATAGVGNIIVNVNDAPAHGASDNFYASDVGICGFGGGVLDGVDVGRRRPGFGGFTSLGASIAPQSGWALDTSFAAQSLASGASLTLASGSGAIILNNSGSGETALFLVGGGVVTLVSSTGSSFVASSSPAAGKIGLFYTSSGYAITSNFGSTATIGVGGTRVRASN